ncbi:gp46 recombination endonuclease subunit [Acinetobacter phage Acj61]|uniref:Gp46 recombination endonuclease subunit n=1 Tax=Acinetobacter phage Acj61 TaxID=760732 RepID=E5E486_9CAUD|nr:SbcC-like subunit of palindrome specific endonuclease [Acinetobacter phage Acj61]ADG36070.1 gp46 recombination endonuclease subunit [Acinetobacter phage Acj61]
MKTFKLNSVAYKNIMSVGDTEIRIALDAHHKTLITGKNGGGKSTMLEAITFALFGKPFRDIKKGQLVNSVTKKALLVELAMEYDGHVFEIARGIKPNVFTVKKDGVPIDESASVRDFQTHFEEMIGMNYASFKQIVVLGTAGYTPFMGLNTPSRRKLVEDLLEVTILAEMDKLNKSAIRELNTDVQQIDLTIGHTQTQIKTHNDYAERQKKLSGDNITRLQTMKDEAMAEIEKIKAENQSLNEKILGVDAGEDPSDESHNAHRAVVQIEGELNQTVRVLSLYQKGGSCPTCLQQLSDDSLVDKIEDSKASLTSEFERLKEVHAEVHSRKVAHLNAKEEIRRYENQIATNRQLAVQQVERIRKINAALEEASKEFVDNTEEVNSLQSKLNNDIQHKSDLVLEKHRRGLITEMLKDSGIKGSIIKKYIPLFNKQINHYLNIMEADYSFVLDEEFSETIKSRGREEFTYASFSQGEKARIDIALLFTWRDIAEKVSGIKINCLFLDEVFDGPVDAQAMKSINQILGELKDANIFIISHRDHNPQDYGQHLQMKKVGRFTIME